MKRQTWCAASLSVCLSVSTMCLQTFCLQIAALLCVGLYPNVCFHKEKRRLLTSEGKAALIHKSSVNLINKEPRFSSPYFVFGEKVLTLVYGLVVSSGPALPLLPFLPPSLSFSLSSLPLLPPSPSSLPPSPFLPLPPPFLPFPLLPPSPSSPPPQLKTRAVSAKTMTMVEPVQLLLFGASSVVAHPGSIVKMDDW